jgi:hypothetical protein
MDQYTQELRLLWFLGLNTLLLANIARAASAFSGNRRSWLLLDVLLFNYVIEYALVCGLGVFGLLTPVNLSIGAVLIAAVLILLSPRTIPSRATDAACRIGYAPLFVLLFPVAYELAFLVYRRDLPVLETDALAYHLPVAIEWLRTAHLPILQTWYWNPTNTYSPMGAEAFIAWLIAPMGSDLFARSVQAPALIMVLLAMYRIARTLGASPFIAACAAAATVLSRSFFSQASIVKDDLIVAAIFLIAVAALADVAHAKRAGDRLSPLRVGCAIGLLIATKYPALIALPLLLLLLAPRLRTAPFRKLFNASISDTGVAASAATSASPSAPPVWTKFQLATAAFIAFALPAPWFLRNAIAFGNPLYPLILKVAGHPLFPGLFRTDPDPAMHTPSGIWHMMTAGYFGTPAPFLAAVALLWLMGLLIPNSSDAGSEVLPRPGFELSTPSPTPNPLRHFAGLGALAGLILYAVASPYPEVRYFLPFFLPFYAGATRGLLAFNRWPPIQALAALAFVIAAAGTTFETEHIAYVVQFSLEAGILAGLALALVLLWRTRRRFAIAILTLAAILLAGVSYVQFNSFADRVAENADVIWSRPDTYGPLGEAWFFIRHNLPPASTIAYANTNLIDPLYGPAGTRRLVYAPVRLGVHTLADLPPFGEHIPQDQIFQATTAAMNQNADLATWQQNLRQSGAEFLFLVKHGSSDNPPEAGFIAALDWKPIFENEAAALYRINAAR